MTPKRKVKTTQEVRGDFERAGITYSDWARQHGFTKQLVNEVLEGRVKAKRGKSHRIAVLLGLKEGTVQ